MISPILAHNTFLDPLMCSRNVAKLCFSLAQQVVSPAIATNDGVTARAKSSPGSGAQISFTSVVANLKSALHSLMESSSSFRLDRFALFRSSLVAICWPLCLHARTVSASLDSTTALSTCTNAGSCQSITEVRTKASTSPISGTAAKRESSPSMSFLAFAAWGLLAADASSPFFVGLLSSSRCLRLLPLFLAGAQGNKGILQPSFCCL